MAGSTPKISENTRRLCAAAGIAGVLVLLGPDVVAWLRFGLSSSLYSYTLLVPMITIYLLWDGRRREDRTPPPPVMAAALLTTGVACVGLAALGWGRWNLEAQVDHARCAVLVTLFAIGILFWRGTHGCTQRLFPALFLFFALPLSPEWEQALSEFLQRCSGWTAYHLIQATGTPVVREGPFLLLPGLDLEVAEECSGIRSTLVLVVTSVLAAYWFLRRLPFRLALVAVVIPLGILRNAFRILVIAWLTLYVDPGIIHGPLHRRGGPLFFALSLLLLLVWLCLLRAWDRQGTARTLRGGT